MEEQSKKNKYLSKERLFEIIFEADTHLGKAFDVALLIFIIASVLVVIIETIPGWSDEMIELFHILEWIFTIFFTIEYILRIYVLHKASKYVTSFFGIIDLVSILPSYLALLLPVVGASFMSFRALRLLRIFRIFKLANFLKESRFIVAALKHSRPKIAVFLTFVILIVIVMGAVMYVVEGGIGHNEQFSSIPTSIYWAIVTLTTVGYGDISPITPFGRFISAFVMILGYAVIAVPTGIISAEFVQAGNNKTTVNEPEEEVWLNTQLCQNCGEDEHADDASYCKVCGSSLHINETD